MTCPNCNLLLYNDPSQCRGCGMTFETQAMRDAQAASDADKAAAETGDDTQKETPAGDDAGDPVDQKPAAEEKGTTPGNGKNKKK